MMTRTTDFAWGNRVDGLIARVALERYEAFNNTASSSSKKSKRTEQPSSSSSKSSCRGKPNPDAEWTVYSALVAIRRRRRRRRRRDDDDDDADTQCEMMKDEDEAWVVSCATGTKCTTERRNGWILHDCHAEVLVRRGLVRALLDEVRRHHRDQDHDHRHNHRHRLGQDSDDATSMQERESDRRCLLEPIHPASISGAKQPQFHQFRLRPDTTLHLYISDSPCGDASIYELERPVQSSASQLEEKDDPDERMAATRSGGNAQFTGSKLVVPSGEDTTTTRCCTESEGGRDRPELQVLSRSATGGSLFVRETGSRQLLGRLRSKSSRSNVARRSQSLSCSDKICRWQVLGWQGCGLLQILPEPIRAATVVVSRDPRSAPSVAASTNVHCCDQEAALQRALVDRVERSFTRLRSVACEGDSSTGTDAYGPLVCRTLDFRVAVVDSAFANGKSQMLWKQSSEASAAVLDATGPTAPADETPTSNRKRRRAEAPSAMTKKVSPCGFALNWNASMGRDALPEVLVGARGVRQGKVPRTDAEHRSLASQLCRARLADVTARVLHESRITPRGQEKEDGATAAPTRYSAFKRALAPPAYWSVRNQLFSDEASPLAGWLVDEQEGDFELARHETTTYDSSDRIGRAHVAR
jgi:Adenosine-deaminase (editase) domain